MNKKEKKCATKQYCSGLQYNDTDEADWMNEITLYTAKEEKSRKIRTHLNLYSGFRFDTFDVVKEKKEASSKVVSFNCSAT